MLAELPPLAERPGRVLPRVDFERMVEQRMFEDERVELLRGTLVEMSPQGRRHMAVIRRLNKILVQRLGDRAEVHPQGPLALSDDSEPEPDMALIAPCSDAEHPAIAYLVIEVAKTSLPKDRGIKAALYAECGIADYWIINLVEGVIEVFRSPEGGHYRAITSKRPGESITLLAFPDVAIDVSQVFGSRVLPG